MRISDWSSDVCSSDLNAAVLAGLPDPLILVGESRRVLRLNPAAEALLGHDLRGRELALGIRNPDLLAAVDAVLRAASRRPSNSRSPRSDGRRGGKEGVRTCSYGGAACIEKKKK